METYPAPPDTEELGYRKYRLTKAYRIVGPDWTLTIPEGFVFDGASVPRFVWLFISPQDIPEVAALVHDFLYRHRGAPPGLSVVPCGRVFSREEADQLFQDIMLDRGVTPWKRRAAFRAVRLFGKYPA